MSFRFSNQNGYLLTIDDEKLIQAGNKRALERYGYSVSQAYTLSQAKSFISQKMPRAISLDIMMPDGNGLEFLRELRQMSNTPVLILSSKAMSEDIIEGFEAGADDYMPKPYDINVYIMRMAALVRRASLVPDVIEMGPLMIDVLANKAYLHGEDLRLQQKELSLLQLFVQHPGIILNSEYLYEKVWGEKMLAVRNPLKVAISKLRKHLAGSGYTIISSRFEGYCFEEDLS